MKVLSYITVFFFSILTSIAFAENNNLNEELEKDSKYLNLIPGTDIVSCLGNLDFNRGKVIVMRYSLNLSSFDYWTLYRPNIIGNIVVISGIKSRGSSFGSSAHLYESDSEVPDNGEAWTVPFPENAIFASKGNLQAVTFEPKGQEIIAYYHNPYSAAGQLKVRLTCTSSVGITEKWIKDAKRFTPL